MKISVKDMCFIGIFATLISASAVSIPLPGGVPVTLQTFIIMLAGVILGPKKGMLAVFVYILIGAVGVPVFSGFRGGFAVITGPTGGFIMTFPLITLFSGLGVKGNKIIKLSLWTGAGVILNYFCGMLWFTFITDHGFRAAFTFCVLPFLPADTVKVMLTIILGRQIKAILSKGNIYIS